MGRIVRETRSDRFTKFMISSMISAIFSFVIGLIVFLCADKINVLLGLLTGIIFIFSGLVSLYKFLKRDGAKLYSMNLIFSILMIIVGIAIMFTPSSVSSFAMVCMGLYLIIFGANKISYAVWFKIGNDSSWLLTLVIGIMIILFGILVMFNPFESSMSFTKVIGIFIMLSSVLDFTDVLMLKKRKDEIVKIFW